MKKFLIVFTLFTLQSFLSAFEIDAVAFNIRFDNPKDGENAWPNRKEMVGKWIESESPDVIGLQEALRHQINDIKKVATAYSEYGVGRDDGKSRGEHCTILYLKKRFTLDKKDCGTFWFSDTPEKIASKSWGNEIPRICTWARLIHKKTGKGFYLYNVHYDHQSQSSRIGASNLIIERISNRKQSNEPIILMGDFNAAEKNPAITVFKEEPLKLVDTFRVVKPDEKMVKTFHGFRGGSFMGGKIDHVFILPKTAKVRSAEIVRFNKDKRYLSDHYPVRAKLSFATN
ncbi:MAG: endonuclease/exonuclease/phosphatase family protein [Verrucomicrobiota bacterium]|jgi:endonuclease/exonuclease/phosphatase family metal-dependent hydrolase|nr:endonuclease/exonuclease/phosphatase family protein [Verrucomicrobiota bacterium]MEC8657726.1 endonuclease/exonuclease/phosphatase family protein [Verrucomicrobiota bacterium]|tara:strand:- start:2173 stop:3030 length:858 start_codon:yes stop_codon:yes gene_type:complete